MPGRRVQVRETEVHVKQHREIERRRVHALREGRGTRNEERGFGQYSTVWRFALDLSPLLLLGEQVIKAAPPRAAGSDGQVSRLLIRVAIASPRRQGKHTEPRSGDRNVEARRTKAEQEVGQAVGFQWLNYQGDSRLAPVARSRVA